MNYKLVILFLKDHGAWFIPLIALMGSGIGYAIDHMMSTPEKPGTLLGKVTGIPNPVIVSIDGSKQAKTTLSGFYRIENISPGHHEISFGPENFDKPQALETEIKGGTEQKLDLNWTSVSNRPEPSNNLQFRNTDSNIHSWFAGTIFNGVVDMTDTFNFAWKCSGGTCRLTGPYGEGLNMGVCQELSRKVGKIDYYYNDTGMKWTETENPELLEQCNNPPIVMLNNNDSNLSLSKQWTDFLDKAPDTLNQLITPIGKCLINKATNNPIFNGCADWHSAVHAAWATLRYEQLTNNNEYFSIVEKNISKLNIESEYTFLRENPKFEMPYGRAWFLRFAIEYKNTRGNSIFDQMSDYVANSMIDYFKTTEINPLAPAYDNPSWALINLYEYGKHKKNPAIYKFVENLVSKQFLKALPTCNLRTEIDQDSDFMAVCSNLAYLLAKTGHKEDVKKWAQSISLEDGVPLKNPINPHQKGLNFSRAWAFYGLSQELNDPIFLHYYLDSFNYEFSQTEWWKGDYSVSHWVPQFGIYALTMTN